MMIFLSGFILGRREGLLVGAMSGFIFCFFNPLGASALPLLTVQLIYYSLVGFMGAIIRGFLNRKDYFKPNEDLFVFKVIFILG